ncbi:hypothetical protein BLAT2472_40352 [Burkholderia latens]
MISPRDQAGAAIVGAVVTHRVTGRPVAHYGYPIVVHAGATPHFHGAAIPGNGAQITVSLQCGNFCARSIPSSGFISI